MKTLLVALFSLLFLPAFLQAAPPSDESIKELLTLTEAQKLVDSMMGQVDSMMDTAMKQALAGKQLTDDEKATIDKMRSKMVAIMKEEFSWDKLQDMYLQIYRESFTQEELDGLIAFYKSPTGQAFIKKMPVVMQKTMGVMQQKMGPLMQKLQAMQEETISGLK